MSRSAHEEPASEDPFAAIFGTRRGRPHSPAAGTGGSGPSSDPSSRAQAPQSSFPCRRYSRTDVIHAIHTCTQSIGCTPTQRDYEHWRVRQALAAGGQTTQLDVVPSGIVARQLFGRWALALRAAGI